ncbi:hypothetical protein MOSE0_G05336 [Monosporozyma servazzii]
MDQKMTAVHSEVTDLKKRIYQLEQLVQKQNKIITKTGQNVIELQMDKQKRGVQEFANIETNVPSQSQPSTIYNNKGVVGFDTSDFATNEDIVQLVGELQIELNNIEERSIRRMINASKHKPKDILAPLPNADGETPTFDYDFFPTSLDDFININDFNLIKLAKFYECLPPTPKDKEELDKFLNEKIENIQISEDKNNSDQFSDDVLVSDEQLKEDLKHYNKDQLNDIFNEVARYLGLGNRRGTDIW